MIPNKQQGSYVALLFWATYYRGSGRQAWVGEELQLGYDYRDKLTALSEIPVTGALYLDTPGEPFGRKLLCYDGFGNSKDRNTPG